ncbi:MAG: flagellar type III secretion system pore protein FliP [Gammaproteobacteria bacterium]
MVPGSSIAQDLINLPGIEINLTDGVDDKQKITTAIKVAAGLTILSLAPAIIMMMTSFTRIVIVLSILRHALGMQQTPPNTVIISLAIFLTIFSMWPVIDRINSESYEPYIENKLDVSSAIYNAKVPMRDFMVSQTREQDLALMLDISKSAKPNSIDEIKFVTLIPAFLISELKSAFQIGFIIFIPFLLIDIVVASILMSMGMMMVPPMMMSLPIKILMFVLIDGWNLIIGSLLNSFF